MTLRFPVVYAARSLRRGGQRSLLAITCVTFGVLALVAMQLLAHVVGQATGVPPRLNLGGDLLIHSESGRLSADQRSVLDSYVADGSLSAVTVMGSGGLGMLRSSGSGRVQLVWRALGVDPATYPLTGDVRLRDGVSLAEAISRPYHIALTRDLARGLGTVRGDTLRYGEVGRTPARLVVGGIIDGMPDRNGQTLLYSMDTAERVAGGVLPMTFAAATAGDDSAGAARLEAAGFSVIRAAGLRPDDTARLFGTMLRGAGLLGLILGGIGIAYTLQVMLTRRRPEIATLRAIGYRTRQLVILFGLEAGALGVIGGVLGAGLAVLLSARLVSLLDRTSGSLMLEYSIAAGPLLAGPIVGLATAVLFGTAAILRASAVRPGVLLRDLPVRPPFRAALGAVAVYVLLALVFTVMAGIVMQSLIAGVGVVLLAIAGIVVLGAVLMALLWLMVRLPLPHLPLVHMARANLRSRQVRSAFSLIALFVGVFAIGFAAAAMQTGSDRVASRRGSDAGMNIRVLASESGNADVGAALRAVGATVVIGGHSMPVRVSDDASERIAIDHLELFDAEDIPLIAAVSAAAGWDASAAVVLMPQRFSAASSAPGVGDVLTLATATDTVFVRIGGFYTAIDPSPFTSPRGLIGGPGVAAALNVREEPESFLASVPESALADAAPALGERLPAAFVISRKDVNDFTVATYQSLFTFVVALAGLALVAGAVLIANAVSLAMVERRRELGVLKAVGFTSRRVLRTILLENGALGVIAGLAGIVAVRIVVAVLNAREARLNMEFGAMTAVALLATSVVLAMAAAGMVAWGPVRVRPLEVLRDE